MIPHNALVLVGDGAKALFLRNSGEAHRPKLTVERVLAHDNPATRDQGTDKPGRAFARAGATRRSAMGEADWHELGEERFAGDIAQTLYGAAHAGVFSSLVVVAPPRILGILRKAFHKEVIGRIASEVAKDLTSLPVAEIERHLAE